jgi:hypothetical protein
METPSRPRRRAAALQLLLVLVPLASCGTLLFPERRDQEGSKVDPNVVVMDASLLIFWIVPGVVAFVVDFVTGGIYLPPGITRGEGPLFGEDALFDLRAGGAEAQAEVLPGPRG